MRRRGVIECTINARAIASLRFLETLEVSLDCVACLRRTRTVSFGASGSGPPLCHPTRHPYDGELLERTIAASNSIRFVIGYGYVPFVDTKYPDELRYHGMERGAPTWARIHFEVCCASCGRLGTHSTQTNIVRPWLCACTCGAILYEDTAPPALSWSRDRDRERGET